MPRLISEIKDPKLRKLAELRREEEELQFAELDGVEYFEGFDALKYAFIPDITDEGRDFWHLVEQDKITELPKDHPLYDEL